ncbi:MAG: double zinc ribbon domain-containing protein [Bacteroidales bacterium]|nr:double zinc ribbon domain-containing protein [Bacteroidales bacterium]
MTTTALLSDLKSLANSFLHFLYPAHCPGCGQEMQANQGVICWRCATQLPFTQYEKTAGNPVLAELAGRVPVQFASAMLFYKKQGIVQNLLHALKYNGHAETGIFLGRVAGERLRVSAAFRSPDFLVPVPLHPEKERKRGYNQSLCIATGIGYSFPETEIVGNLLKKPAVSESQTRKNRTSRWENVKTAFCLSETALKEARFQGRHFLLVDDVFTTGATAESCVRQLLRIDKAKVSVVTIASPA